MYIAVLAPSLLVSLVLCISFLWESGTPLTKLRLAPAVVYKYHVWSNAGILSAAALKRWEKAAMAGVSLVADAAEHLERTAGENPTANQGGYVLLCSAVVIVLLLFTPYIEC